MLNRRFMYALLILLLLPSNSTLVYASASALPNLSDSIQRSVIQPSVTINGMNVSFQGPLPALVDGTTYVTTQLFEHPDIQADITEFLGSKYPTVYFSHFNGALDVYQDSSKYRFIDFNVDAEESESLIDWKSPSPYLSEGDIMVPLRAIAERIGISVGWDVTTSTATLTTDEDFRAELESREEWAEWLGMKPIEFDDPSGVEITKEELIDFVSSTGLPVLDSRIIDKYSAVLLYIEVDDGVESLMLRDVERLRNGNLDLGSTGLGMGDNEVDIKVKRIGDLVSVGMFKQGLDKEFTHFEVSYYVQGETVAVTYDITDKQGMFIDIPEDVTSGGITFYGKNGYTFETYFF